jgi:type VI secretion system protein ImpH
MTPPDTLVPVLARARGYAFVDLVAFVKRELGDVIDRHGHVVHAMDRIRFRHDPDLAFSTSDVVRATWNPDDALGLGGVEITTSFLGLTGTVTPLPLYFTEEIVQDDSDAPMRLELLDVFHNRLLRAFATGCLGLDYAKSFDTDGADRISTWARGMLAFPDGEEPTEQTTSWLRYAPAFVQGGNSADGLLAVLRGRRLLGLG